MGFYCVIITYKTNLRILIKDAIKELIFNVLPCMWESSRKQYEILR